ncbi:MAG: hypothetical protein ROW39_08550, partial [Anaerolineaceae bacterium]
FSRRTISLAFFSSRVSVIGALLFLGMPQFSHALPKNRNAPSHIDFAHVGCYATMQDACQVW